MEQLHKKSLRKENKFLWSVNIFRLSADMQKGRIPPAFSLDLIDPAQQIMICQNDGSH